MRTCTLLIVDDEPIVRYGVRHSIDWAMHDILVVGEAENGAVALDKARLLRPDIILCDIKMPMVNGLAFILKLKDILPGTNIVILTGYADSEYLMQALRSGVKDYLLKPAGMEAILEAVSRVADGYRQRQAAEWEQNRKEDLLAENLLILQSAFFTKLLEGGLPEEVLLEKALDLHISLAGPRYQLLLLGAQSQPLQIMQICKKVYEAFAPFVVSHGTDNVIAVLLNVRVAIPIEQLSEASVDVIRQTESIIAVSEVAEKLSSLPELYHESLSLIKRNLWFEHVGCESVSQLISPDLPAKELDRLERMLIRATTEGDPDVIADQANQYFSFMQQYKPEYEQTEAHFGQLIRTIRMLSGESAVPPEDDVCCTVGQLRKRLFDACKVSFLDTNRGRGQSGRALRYIEQHYMEELSLESVAGCLFLSPTYLSRLLKEKTNHGFQYWINYFRIQRAKELLLDDRYKSYEIADMVGYNSYKIFSGHFSRFAHCTTTEFRQRALLKSENENCQDSPHARRNS